MSALFNPRTAFPGYGRQGEKMDAIIGRYRVLTQETSLTLTHPTGISFTLTLAEVVELMLFIKAHQPAIVDTLDAIALEGETHLTDEEDTHDKDRL